MHNHKSPVAGAKYLTTSIGLYAADTITPKRIVAINTKNPNKTKLLSFSDFF